jgi:hypothetical protein
MRLFRRRSASSIPRHSLNSKLQGMLIQLTNCGQDSEFRER